MRKNLATIALTAGVLLAVLFLVFHQHQTSKEEVLSQFNKNQLRTAQQTASSIERYFHSRSQDLEWLTYISSQQSFDIDKTVADIKSALNRLKMTHIRDVDLLNEKGIVVHSTTAHATGKNHSQAGFFSWAKNPKNKGAVRIFYENEEGPRIPVTAGSPAPPHIVIFLVTPLYHQESAGGGHQQPGRKFVGVLMFTVDLEKMLAERSPLPTPSTKLHGLWIIERGGTLLVHSGHPEMVMRSVLKRNQTCYGCHTSFDYLETIRGKSEGVIQYQINGKPKKVAAFASMSFENASWVVVVNTPLDEVTAFVWENLKDTLFLLGIVILLLGLAFFSAYRNYRQKVYGEIEVKRLQENQKLMDELRENEEKFRAVFEGSNDAIMLLNKEGFFDCNGQTLEMFKISREDFLKARPADLSPPFQLDGKDSLTAELERIQTAYQTGSSRFEWLHQRKNGEIFDADVSLSAFNYRGQTVLQATVRDITDKIRMEKEIREISVRDQLTELYNRRGFITLAEQQLKAANRAKRKLLLTFLDCDGLKWINDTLGHEEGDKSLIAAANILRQTFRESDIIARMGGDEFAVLTIDAVDMNPEVLSKRLRQNIDEYNATGSRQYELSMSWGTAIYDPESPISLDELILLADTLMYTQKKAKSNKRI